jgi:FkbM family methyltransferase
MAKLATVKHVLQTRGVRGFISAVKDKLSKEVFSLHYNWYLGKLIELRGNIVRIDGCSFSVDSPIISTKFKCEFLFDNYERPERQAVQRFLDPSLPLVEFGGSVGVVSCLANRRLSDPSQHVVIEANPDLIPLLKKNRDRNECKFTILPRVVAYGSEQVVFHSNKTNFVGSTALTHHANDTIVGDVLEDIEVQTITLQSVLDQYGFNQCTLICDIEGAEAELVEHEFDVIMEKVRVIIIEVHEYFLGKEGVRNLLARFEELGFRYAHHEQETYVFQRRT